MATVRRRTVALPRKPRTRAPYKMVSPPTWALARADYLGGMTAQQVADRHGIGLHNLRQTIARKGWSKRALADARATPGPGGPPVVLPASAAEPALAAGDLLETVLARVRAALIGGRGAEASALLKATREYVIVQQDVADARAANAEGLACWDRAQPARAGALTETVTIQTLHARWSKLSEVELAMRADPTGEAGLKAWVEAVADKGAERGRR